MARHRLKFGPKTSICTSPELQILGPIPTISYLRLVRFGLIGFGGYMDRSNRFIPKWVQLNLVNKFLKKNQQKVRDFIFPSFAFLAHPPNLHFHPRLDFIIQIVFDSDHKTELYLLGFFY